MTHNPTPGTAEARYEQYITLRRQGQSYSAIAKELGVTPQAVRQSVRRRAPELTVLTEKDRRMIRMRRAGLSFDQVATGLGTNNRQAESLPPIRHLFQPN